MSRSFCSFSCLRRLPLAAGSVVTAPAAAGCYQTLQRPAFAQPDAVFAPVGTAIFLLMAMAGWRVWRRAGWTAAQALFGLQLVLNFAWSALFFGLRRPDLALAEILVPAGTIVGSTCAFGRVDPVAVWLLAPYLAWVAFALLDECRLRPAELKEGQRMPA